MRRLLPIALKRLLQSPLLPRIQKRVFLGAPLPLLDPEFGFERQSTSGAAPASTPEDLETQPKLSAALERLTLEST